MAITTQTTSSPYGGLLVPILLVAIALLASAALVNAIAMDSDRAVINADSKVEKAVSDGWITTQVRSEILANSATKSFKVRVKTRGGVVFLKGKLPSQEAAALVMSIAEKVKGVQGIDTSGLDVS